MADNMVQILEGLGSGGGCAGCRGGVGGLGAAAPGTVWSPGLVLAALAIGAAWWLGKSGNNHRINLGSGRRRRGLGGLGFGARSYGSVLPAR
jgi:hypothetical protein